MKILLTNNHLLTFGGTETWIKTMAHEYKRQGHDVRVFTCIKGEYANWLQVPVLSVSDYLYTPDVALANHTSTLEYLKPEWPTIFTSHSYFLDLEKFPEDRNVIKVAVTEEIRDGREDVTVIPNGIDISQFCVMNRPNDKLGTVLYLGNHNNMAALPTIRQACDKLGVDLKIILGNERNIAEIMNQCDLVITLGRGLLEAMACGRNVISGDYRSWMSSFQGGGMITPENFEHLRTHAFSGRNDPIEFDVDRLAQEMALYAPQIGLELRKLIVRDFDAFVTTNQYLSLL